MAEQTYILGVGLTRFLKPRGLIDYPALGFEAGIKALNDAGVSYDDITHGVACYAYGDSTCGQRVFYQFGMTGIPLFNVNNNCSTGSTGLFMARQLCSAGLADAVLVVGFEKMAPGSLQSAWRDRTSPIAPTHALQRATHDTDPHAPNAAQLFGNAGREYMARHGATAADFAEIARVNHAHSARNPYSQFRDVYTRAQIEASPAIWPPLTKLQCCPTSDGGAAAVVVGERFLAAHPALRARAVRIAGMSMTTDSPALYSGSAIDLVGYDMTVRATRAALAEAGVAARDVRLVELHDCFSSNELITLDAMGLCEPGKAHEMVRAGDITYGGRVVVNPSGGLISKGHPLGATGVAQCAELVWHLRGWAGERTVPVKAAVQQNLGLGGAAVVAVYVRADGEMGKRVEGEAEKIGGRGYNPAVEARGITQEEIDAVRSKRVSKWAGGEPMEAKGVEKQAKI
ncbi:thiolase-like protein [Geopyxis carbonaria]|nr:thiolase-like protein [Geopyxis carbonaria]